MAKESFLLCMLYQITKIFLDGGLRARKRERMVLAKHACLSQPALASHARAL